MTNLSGTPGVSTTVTALGNIIANNVKGKICVLGVTKRGEVGKPVLCATWGDFLQSFGGLRDDSDFPLMCKHALEAGSLLYVAREGHFTDIDNLSTLTGTKATKSLSNTAVVAAGASISFTLADWDGAGDTISIVAPDLVNGGTFTLLNYAGVGVQTVAAAVTAILGAINAGSLTHLYVATNPSGSIITITKPASLGAAGNGDIVNLTFSGPGASISGASLKFSGGVNAYAALTSTWTAKGVGAGYNGLTVNIVPSTSGVEGEVDITVTLPDAPNTQEIKGVPRVLDARKVKSLNKQLEGVEVSVLVAYTLPLGTVVLAGGAEDINLITDADFKGSSVAKNGLHSFDEIVDSMRIFNIGRPTHDANLALALYCEARKDMRGRGYFPKGLTITGLNNFRDGDGAYLHVPIDSWYLDAWVAEVYISDPENLENKEYDILAGGLQCANRSKADNEAGEWISDSGNDYGKIKGVNGLRLNLVSPGNKGQFDTLYEKGVNAVVNDQALKVVNWGNRTTLLDTTSLLSKSNIADMVVYISREISSIAKLMNFKPNDIRMFNELYRKVAPWIKDVLVAGRAIEGDDTPSRGEGTWWFWLGDQLAADLNDLKLNKKSDVDAGKYRVRFAFKPIGANEYIAIDIAPADSTTILNVSVLTDLSL